MIKQGNIKHDLRISKEKDSTTNREEVKLMDKIVIHSYSDEWPGLFDLTAKKLRQELGEVAMRIDHIGSTSIKGLAAKPIIDIQISVESFNPIGKFQIPLERLGYVFGKDNPEKTKRYFREKPGDRRTHIHVRKLGSWHQQFPILFRDYLRYHPVDMKLYENEKYRLAETYKDNRTAYVEGKNKVFWEIIFQADRWAGEIGWEPGPSDA